MSQSKHRSLAARAFALTWLSYASYYLTRKNFSVVKSRLQDDLGITMGQLGTVDTVYLGLYAVGQFVNGSLGDRVGPRRMLAIGMILSAVAALTLSFATGATIFIVVFGLNGLFQSTGWPNNVKAMTPWFSRAQRGKIMGIWTTNYQVGGLVATALATWLLVTYGWRAAFRVPGLWVAGVGVLLWFALVERPPTTDPVKEAEVDTPVETTPLGLVIRSPIIWLLGGSYFGLKLIRYSLLFWLPYYLNRGLGYDEASAGYLSTAFEAGGIAGAILTGWLSDRFSHNRMRLVVPMLIGLAVALGVYQQVGGLGWQANAAALAVIGFLLFGPDALISGAAAQDVGGERAAATAAGFINGLGSIGAILQGIVTSQVSEHYGWESLFYVFVAVALVSAGILMPLALKKSV